jgi:tRNA threonylcarbamoyladenosine biosynthesis protein TsaB
MLILAIDCSTEWLGVAAGNAGELHERREHVRQSHSERVLPLVDAVLADAGASLDDVTGIAFGAGPGSFTGVRIACGVAQGLGLGRGLPLVGVSTLEALAEEAFAQRGVERVLACLDARMREVYVAAYGRSGTVWREVVPAAVARPAAVASPPGTWFGAGNGFAAYGDLAARLALPAFDAAIEPTARAIARLAEPRFAAGEGVDAEHALPMYVRHRVALTPAERASGAVL